MTALFQAHKAGRLVAVPAAALTAWNRTVLGWLWPNGGVRHFGRIWCGNFRSFASAISNL